ncbi:hypothetical protein HRE53_23490 [Acaryochloris sp. 'Moss Beach']|uniref:hypothetical protein n=1 Tax=Acaryochloris TaxID=155977 RepID=UPI001BB07EAE|nr:MULTISPECIES: hypothetical protein [Acaryochloris]QUY44521.1 hypothetical protein I1H34_10785 [Acaryochloris marina S15]UJB69299.1 hypothetical protein HRE53_23490 [Acaryochloris sp. 'Moss Beach']
MRIWLISFLTLLALARGFEWLQHLALPFPILLLGGALLSVLSNESTLAGLPWMPKSQSSQIEPAATKNTLTPQ